MVGVCPHVDWEDGVRTGHVQIGFVSFFFFAACESSVFVRQPFLRPNRPTHHPRQQWTGTRTAQTSVCTRDSQRTFTRLQESTTMYRGITSDGFFLCHTTTSPPVSDPPSDRLSRVTFIAFTRPSRIWETLPSVSRLNPLSPSTWAMP